MNNYYDDLGFIHDKPIDQKYLDEGNYWQLSNNKFCYTAYSMRVGLIKVLIPGQIEECEYCLKFKVRHSFKLSPVISRDEILGLCYLLKDYYQSIASPVTSVNFVDYLNRLVKTWNFSPFPLPKFSLITLIKQLWRIRKEHRNFWWENNLNMVGHVACMVPFQDRAFILRTLNKPCPLIYQLIEWIDKKLKPSSRSSAAIRSFKYNQDNFKGIYDYFKFDDHPIKTYLNSLYNKA